ncbi:MAG: GPP34 family phosphoprotein [Actinomycetota bacterium]|nr:GPP34 family phosphoprotein [Actinomycetota bacterium]
MELELQGRTHVSRVEIADETRGGVAKRRLAAKGWFTTKLEVIDPTPTGDEVLDPCLAAFAASDSPGAVRLDKALGESYRGRLVAQGWFSSAGTKALVRERPKYQVANQDDVGTMKENLLDQLASDGPLEPARARLNQPGARDRPRRNWRRVHCGGPPEVGP